VRLVQFIGGVHIGARALHVLFIWFGNIARLSRWGEGGEFPRSNDFHQPSLRVEEGGGSAGGTSCNPASWSPAPPPCAGPGGGRGGGRHPVVGTGKHGVTYLTWSVTGRASRRNFLQSCELGTSSPSGFCSVKSFLLPCYIVQLMQKLTCQSKYINGTLLRTGKQCPEIYRDYP
jgi:hypothetical protein